MHSFSWNLEPEVEEPGSAGVPARRRARTLTPALLVVYLLALLVAGVLGFRLGRASVTDANQVREVDTQLALEALAWKSGDLDLYRSTLAPSAPEAWLRRQLTNFHQYAPVPYEAEIEDEESLDETTKLVRVKVTLPQGPQSEVRTYRLERGVWGRTAMDGEG